MLQLKKITKVYKIGDNETTALKGISLTFRDHEFVSILGPSGCGKTTLLNIIGGLDQYTSGDLLINGRSTKEYKDKDWDTYRNHSIGFVFQSYNLIPHQTILKNVELALSISGVSKKERKKKATDALIKVGLGDQINKKPNQLSGGQCQRASIARAIVNNPDIILADEPTGALDTETSIQVMEILKEISKERLVIMVTHNPDLARDYSTRIVKILDGNLMSDSNPVLEKEQRLLLNKIEENKNVYVDKKEQRKAEKKASMSLWTSIRLSASNLQTKKKRTFLTALASSIGIIGIAVILSVSNGMQSYVNQLQEESTSLNYLTISSTYTDTSQSGNNNSDSSVSIYEEYPSDINGIYPYEQSSSINVTEQILSQEYIDYLEENINGSTSETSLVHGISYTREIGLNILSYDGVSYQSVTTTNWQEILDNPTYMEEQYTVLASLENYNSIPQEYYEVALVVDSYNRLSTTILDQLNIDYTDTTMLDYDSLLGKEFVLVCNDDYYQEVDYGENTIYRSINTEEEREEAYNSENSLTLKVTSIIREKESTSNTWVSPGIAYSSSLTDKVLEINAESTVVIAQKENPTYNVLTGESFSESSSGGIGSLLGLTTTSYESNLMTLGGSSTPTSIIIYPKDFDSKDKIIEVLDYWNNTEIYKLYGNEKDEEGNYLADSYKVQYTDLSELLISMLGDLINIITYALIAFSAVSLVVSSIMIAIITYASVIERTKEIGTIRSLGGRKKDVSAVFLSEAGIIGLISACIALLVTVGINAIINLVLDNLVGVSTIAALSLQTALGMIVLSLGLNLIASLIPASIAAKKDPVVALRSE